MQESPLPFFSMPLVAALEGVFGWLERENAARIIAATTRLSELRKDDLPEHVQVFKRPLKGRRVISRNVRHFKQTRRVVAQYPESTMAERAVPVFLCVIRGIALIHVGNYTLKCRPGDFVLIPPKVPKGEFSYAIDNNPQSVCDVLHIYPGRLLGEGLECWIAHSQGNRIDTGAQLGAALFKSEFLAALFNQLSHEIVKAPRRALVFSLVHSLVLFLLQELKEERAIMGFPKHFQPPMPKVQDPIKHAIAYIDSHFEAALTIESMARETALSATSFKLLFRRATGHSFHQHLTNVRIGFAETLLRETDERIQDVAQRAGLSPSRLHRLFHLRHSCSPGEYRRKK